MEASESVLQDVPDPTGAFDKSGDAIQVASRVAHEFNNLLTSILGHCALVRPEVNEDGVPCLEQVDIAAHRAADLSRQLQAYAGQQGAPPMDRTHAYEIVKDMHPLLKAIVRGRIGIEMDLDADTPAVEVDATSLRHLVVHFVLGAVSAAGDAHATVTVGVRKETLDAADTARLRSSDPLDPGEFVCLDISYARHDETECTRFAAACS
jgi:C4-dicarboxylate-specific signal transduction histidine kinase